MACVHCPSLVNLVEEAVPVAGVDNFAAKGIGIEAQFSTQNNNYIQTITLWQKKKKVSVFKRFTGSLLLTVRELDRKAENYFSHSRNPNKSAGWGHAQN